MFLGLSQHRKGHMGNRVSLFYLGDTRRTLVSMPQRLDSL